MPFAAAPLSLVLLACRSGALAQIARAAKPPASEPTPPCRRRQGPPSPAPLQPGDAFGEEVTLPERTIIFLKGHSNWDAAFDTLVDAFKSLHEYLDKQGIKPPVRP